MDNTKIAEALLRITCGRERAYEIVGDILEQHDSKLSFWMTFVSVWAAMMWRWFTAFLLAAGSMMVILTDYARHVPQQTGQQPAALPGGPWVLASLCVWSALVLNLIRFGWRDRTNAVALGAAILLLATASSAKSSVELYAALTVAFFAVVCLLSKGLRAHFVCVAVPTLSFAVAFGTLVHGCSWTADNPKLMAAQFGGVLLISFVLEALTLSLTRKRMLGPASL